MPQTRRQIGHVAPDRTGSILVIGEALIDCFPGTHIAGGAPFNLARNLGAFGAAPVMITRVGPDSSGALLLAECLRFNVSQAGVQIDADLPTGYVDVLPHESGHVFVIADRTAWDAIDPMSAIDVTRQTQPTIVCFGTLAQRRPGSRAAIAGALEQAGQYSALKVLDLNLREGAASADIAEWSLGHADVVKVNDDELAQLFKWFVAGAAAGAREWGSAAQRHAVSRLLQRFPVRHLIVTRGAHGYDAFDSSGELVAAGLSPETNVIDTVGAGDAFTSIVVLGEWLGWTLDLALARASDFAAAVCTLRGAVAANMDFYRYWAERWKVRTADQHAGARN